MKLKGLFYLPRLRLIFFLLGVIFHARTIVESSSFFSSCLFSPPPFFRAYLHFSTAGKKRSSKAGSFTLANFAATSEVLQSEVEPFPATSSSSSTPLSWVGCRDGGYPCALWQLLHVLSVERAHRWRWNRLEEVRRGVGEERRPWGRGNQLKWFPGVPGEGGDHLK
jgi:hypothetical protein